MSSVKNNDDAAPSVFALAHDNALASQKFCAATHNTLPAYRQHDLLPDLVIRKFAFYSSLIADSRIRCYTKPRNGVSGRSMYVRSAFLTLALVAVLAIASAAPHPKQQPRQAASQVRPRAKGAAQQLQAGQRQVTRKTQRQLKSNRYGELRLSGIFGRTRGSNFGFPSTAATHSVATIVDPPVRERPSQRIKAYLRPLKSHSQLSDDAIAAQLAAASSELGLSAVYPEAAQAQLKPYASVFSKYRGRIPRLPSLSNKAISELLSRPKDVALLLGTVPSSSSSVSKLKLPSFYLPFKLGSTVIKPNKILGWAYLKKPKGFKLGSEFLSQDVPIVESSQQYDAPKPGVYTFTKPIAIHSYKQQASLH